MHKKQNNTCAPTEPTHTLHTVPTPAPVCATIPGKLFGRSHTSYPRKMTRCQYNSSNSYAKQQAFLPPPTSPNLAHKHLLPHPHVVLRYRDARCPDDGRLVNTVVQLGNGGVVIVPGAIQGGDSRQKAAPKTPVNRRCYRRTSNRCRRERESLRAPSAMLAADGTATPSVETPVTYYTPICASAQKTILRVSHGT